MTDQQDLRALSVDSLAAIIRKVDGNHSLGATALAEAILSEAAAQLPAGVPDWPKVNEAIKAFVSDYELCGEDEQGRDGSYTPTETERFMLTDCINGLLDDDDFQAAYTPSAPQPDSKESR